MTTQKSLVRRDFLKITICAGTGLVLGGYLEACQPRPGRPLATNLPPSATPLPPTASPVPTHPGAVLQAGAFLKIAADGSVTVTVHRSEMGQGVRTALPMLVAEELEVDWKDIRVEQALADEGLYGKQQTGGSTSIQDCYTLLRMIGAVGRTLLITAAAQVWKADPQDCTAEQGEIVHRQSKQRIPYGQLVEIAADLPVPALNEVKLKDPQDFKLIGTRAGSIDNPDIVTGKAVYGIDVMLPDMLYAVVARCPIIGGKLGSFDASTALTVEGVKQVLEIDSGVAVVAENTWAAIKGRDALKITWDEGKLGNLSTSQMHDELEHQAAKVSPDPQNLEATYEIPYLAHNTLEPMNCTADVRSDSCEVWAPTQEPSVARLVAVSAAGVPSEAFKLNIPLIGGGFGRRLAVDYVPEAVQLSKLVGAPVKVIWTRDDDIQHDLYHPMSGTHVQSGLDECRPRQRFLKAGGGVPTGYWRAVENVQDAYTRECFIDEFAAATGQDPVELRLNILTDRAKAVVQLASEKANWGEPLPQGWGRGIAYHATWGVTHVAQVVEASVTEEGSVVVHRVVCAVDCGQVINPDIVEAQMEGGIIFGLSAALHGGISIEKGQVQQSNFHDSPVLRYGETPELEIYIVPSTESPTGIGEMANPPVMPALANAIYAATGKRIRHIPIRPEDLMEM